MTQRYRKGVSVYLPPAVRERLETRAASESRTMSKMGEILLTQALGASGAGDEPVAPVPARQTAARPSRTRAPRPASPEPKSTVRTTACEHRIGPDAYCPRCDPA